MAEGHAASVARHPIRVVVERTGLSHATLRAWERRYGAVAPVRSDGAQRLYTDEDVRRLKLIARLSAVGHSLVDLSRASTTTLARMARQTLTTDLALDAACHLLEARIQTAINRMLAHTRELDPVALRSVLTAAITTLGPVPALDALVSPFLEQVGIAWACRSLSVAQEHLASTVVRDVLGELLQTAAVNDGGPTFVACTLADEQHEFGAMMSAVVAAAAGWRVRFLGADLPAREIASAANAVDARVIAVSVVNPQPVRFLRDEVATLRRGAGKRTIIVAGGASAGDHQLTLRRASIALIQSRPALAQALERVVKESGRAASHR